MYSELSGLFGPRARNLVRLGLRGAPAVSGELPLAVEVFPHHYVTARKRPLRVAPLPGTSLLRCLDFVPRVELQRAAGKPCSRVQDLDALIAQYSRSELFRLHAKKLFDLGAAVLERSFCRKERGIAHVHRRERCLFLIVEGTGPPL